MLALLGHRALHEQHQKNQPHAQDGEQPEDIEIGERRSLLLAEIGQLGFDRREILSIVCGCWAESKCFRMRPIRLRLQ